MSYSHLNEQAAQFAIRATKQQTAWETQTHLQGMQHVGLLEGFEAILYFDSPTQLVEQLGSTADQYLQYVHNVFVDGWEELLSQDGKRRAFYSILLRLSNLKNVFFIAYTPPAQEYLDSLLLLRNPSPKEHLAFFTGYNRTRASALGRDIERSYRNSLSGPAGHSVEPFWKYRLAVDWLPQSSRRPLTDWHNLWTTQHTPRLTQLVKRCVSEVEFRWIQNIRLLQGLPADLVLIHWMWTEEWATLGRPEE
ncbi:uncharacterized protein BDZ99DRAFT_470891 [Mytilinidion resinicola]|uniref:Uncharacterized protein n=1 Tax=Mytilinidion resinicola TaxID=574789 RepID=A0A6A6ZB87_9PEZI|nr:uncharacterized protein BDZ99DRAFT_470891 [Mytilinidion resinicola]KAF2817959.1 hypothetical protein BDZ99DRAFT_470891 [Mytilinidion resinicola]